MLSRVIMGRVLVAGAGITGALTASMLKQQLPSDATIAVWDKSNGAGGRMSTSRSPKDSSCTVDLGAQYITSTAEDFKLHQRLYSELQSAGIFQQFHEKLENDKFSAPGATQFVAPKGISSLVKHFLNKSESEVKYNHQISDLSIENNKWKVTTNNGHTEYFDSVILTMPVPQILQLGGSMPDILSKQPDITKKLQQVQYSSRFAIGLFYDNGTTLDVPWTGRYIEGDPCIRFISIDSKKRNPGQATAPSIAVHAHVPFSLKHLEVDKEEVGAKHLLPRLYELLPQLPKPSATKFHKWRYSQVHKHYDGQPGALVLNQEPLLICSGDAFSHSNFDGCVKSATATLKLAQQSRL